MKSGYEEGTRKLHKFRQCQLCFYKESYTLVFEEGGPRSHETIFIVNGSFTKSALMNSRSIRTPSLAPESERGDSSLLASSLKRRR